MSFVWLWKGTHKKNIFRIILLKHSQWLSRERIERKEAEGTCKKELHMFGRSIFGYRTKCFYATPLCTTTISHIMIAVIVEGTEWARQRHGPRARKWWEAVVSGKWWTAIDKCKNQKCGIMKTTCNWTTIEIKYQNNLKISVRLSFCWDKFSSLIGFSGRLSAAESWTYMCVHLCHNKWLIGRLSPVVVDVTSSRTIASSTTMLTE